MTSSRFPGKTVANLNSLAVLERVLRQCLKVPSIDKLICAYPTGEEQLPIVDIARKIPGVHLFAGHEENVLSRYFVAASQHRLKVIVRITADCPFTSPLLVQQCINLLMNKWDEADYASNVHPVRTFPRGMDVEVFKLDALAAAVRNAETAFDKEHVTPWIQRNRKITNMVQTYDLSFLNLCVDTQEDLERLQHLARCYDNHTPTGFAPHVV